MIGKSFSLRHDVVSHNVPVGFVEDCYLGITNNVQDFQSELVLRGSCLPGALHVCSASVEVLSPRDKIITR